ncbi:MAG: histidinol-phosphate transaminase [Balneolaceae bacterium]
MSITPDKLDEMVRPNIQALAPYRSARDDFETGLLLDANENSYGSPFPEASGLNRYPHPIPKELRTRIAKWRDVEPEQVFTGVGSDEAIDLLIRIYCEPGKGSILTTPPTYGMYNVSAKIHNITVHEIPLTASFQVQTEAILEKARTERPSILFLCSPNNPTGNDLDRTQILKLIELFPGLVVVDEAYIDFSKQESMAPMVRQYPNLVVLQTFSKSFGLAGIRLGLAFAAPNVINWMLKVKSPYNINTLTARMALKAFDHMEMIRFHIAELRKERERVANALGKLVAVETVFPSQANFLLFRIRDAEQVWKTLTEQGIIIRYRGNEPGCTNCLRATIGLPDENDRLIRALQSITS